jgi:hypothetical protein
VKWHEIKQEIDDAVRAVECMGYSAEDVEIDYIDFWEDITCIDISYDNFENKPHLRIT